MVKWTWVLPVWKPSGFVLWRTPLCVAIIINSLVQIQSNKRISLYKMMFELIWCDDVFFSGYPGSYSHSPYPMPQQGGQSVAPYPVPQGGYGDPSQAPPPGFNMGYSPAQAPIMYQPGAVGPGPVPVPGPEYGAPPGGIALAPAGSPAVVPVGVPPGLEYLTQVG